MASKDEIRVRLDSFRASEKNAWAKHGQRYYAVDNDILSLERNEQVVKENKADERLAHSTYRNLVDEKVSFLLAKEPIITIGKMSDGEKEQLEHLKELLTDFQNKLIALGVNASNTSVGWLQPYIDGDGRLKWHVHEPDKVDVIPVWIDKQERELDFVITAFTTEEFDPKSQTFVLAEKVSVHYANYQEFYEREGNELKLLGKTGYFTIEGEQYTWGRVPFIPFYNNHDEIPDIKLVKSLIDAYDKGRSESQNFVEDIRNFILVLKGYQGDQLEPLIETIKKWGAIAVDSGDGAGVDGLNANMNIADTLTHFTQLKKDLFENAQGVNRDIGAIGSNPTNLSLKFLFAGLNLKADKLEAQFRQSFNEMVEFINIYLGIKGQPLIEGRVRVEFNRDMAMNESELIKDINASVDLSLTSRLEMHPYVDNATDELERLKQEQPFRPVEFNEQA